MSSVLPLENTALGSREEELLALNTQLKQLRTRIEKNGYLKQNLEFRVVPKSTEKARWKRVYNFTSLDFPTTLLLSDPNRDLWVSRPELFTFTSKPSQYVSPNPVFQLAWQCFQLDGADARTAILRRCHFLAYSNLQSRFRVQDEEVMTFMTQFVAPGYWDGLKTYVVNKQRAGSRYAVWEQDIGSGAIVVMGSTLGHDLFVPFSPLPGKLATNDL